MVKFVKSSNDPESCKLQNGDVGYISSGDALAVKVAVNDTVDPAVSVVVCVMSAGTVRLGPKFAHDSTIIGVEYSIILL